MARAFNLKAVLGDTTTGVTAAGTTQGTATTLPAHHCTVTTVTSAARGVILKQHADGDIFSVVNSDTGDTLYIYPWSGAGFNGTTANTHLALPPGTGAIFVQQSPTVIAAIY